MLICWFIIEYMLCSAFNDILIKEEFFSVDVLNSTGKIELNAECVVVIDVCKIGTQRWYEFSKEPVRGYCDYKSWRLIGDTQLCVGLIFSPYLGVYNQLYLVRNGNSTSNEVFYMIIIIEQWFNKSLRVRLHFQRKNTNLKKKIYFNVTAKLLHTVTREQPATSSIQVFS